MRVADHTVNLLSKFHDDDACRRPNDFSSCGSRSTSFDDLVRPSQDTNVRI